MPETFQHRTQSLLQIGLAGGIALDADGLPPQPRDGCRPRFRGFLEHIQNGDIGPGLRQPRRHCPGEDTASSDHHRHLAGQRE